MGGWVPPRHSNFNASGDDSADQQLGAIVGHDSEQQRRLNMIMTGFASQEELDRAKTARPPHVDVTQERLNAVARQVVGLVMGKNADYGDAWQALGEVGAAARFVDKLFRIEHLSNGREALVIDEGLFDTLRDMVGYGLLILLYNQYKEVDNP